MTSLKAICTGLRKLDLFFLFFVVLATSLYSADFRIAICSDVQEYSSLVEDVLDTLKTASSDQALAKLNERLQYEREKQYYISYDKYLRDEDFSSLGSLSLDKAKEEHYANIEVVSPEFSEVEKEYLLSGDEEAFDYIKLRDGYDMIISIALVSDDVLPEIALYVDSRLEHQALYAEALRKNEEDFLFSFFGSLLLGPDFTVVDVDMPSNGTLYVDDEQISTYTSCIVLSEGLHSISYIIPGYKTKAFDVIVDSSTEKIDLLLDKIEQNDLTISTVPFDSTLFYNGSQLDGKMIEKVVYPFTISATHDGFSLYSMQSMTAVDSLKISLKPLWMDSEDMISEAKGNFYMNLFATLMCFGGYIATQSVDNMVDEYDIKPVSVVLCGISLVSLVNMIDSMFEYFDSARMGI